MEDILLSIQGFVSDVGFSAPFTYVLTIVLAIIFSPIPSTPLIILGASIFGFGKGAFLSWLGVFIGAVVTFFIARILGRPIVLRFTPKNWLEITEDKLSEGKLIFSNFSVRLLPLPFLDVVSYAVGLTKISFGGFLISTALGILPLIFIASYFGEIIFENIWLFILFLLVLLVTFFGAIFYKTDKYKKRPK